MIMSRTMELVSCCRASSSSSVSSASTSTPTTAGRISCVAELTTSATMPTARMRHCSLARPKSRRSVAVFSLGRGLPSLSLAPSSADDGRGGGGAALAARISRPADAVVSVSTAQKAMESARKAMVKDAPPATPPNPASARPMSTVLATTNASEPAATTSATRRTTRGSSRYMFQNSGASTCRDRRRAQAGSTAVSAGRGDGEGIPRWAAPVRRCGRWTPAAGQRSTW